MTGLTPENVRSVVMAVTQQNFLNLNRKRWITLCHIRVGLSLCVKTSFRGNVFCLQVHFHANQTHFHAKGFAPTLVLKQRHKLTGKWPILAGGRSNDRKKILLCNSLELEVCTNVSAVRVTYLKAYKIDDFASSTNSASPLLICQDTTCSKDLKRSEKVREKYLCQYVSEMIEFFPAFLYVHLVSL